MNQERTPIFPIQFFGNIIKAIRRKFYARSKKKYYYQKYYGPRGKLKRQWTQDKGLFWVNFILMIGTLVVAWVAVSQSKEVAKEFNISNTPYLQVTKVTDTIIVGSSFKPTIQIENLGKAPAKILWAFYKLEANHNPMLGEPPTTGELANQISIMGADFINSYAINGSPYSGTIEFFGLGERVIVDSTIKDDIVKKQRVVELFGKILYQDLVSQQDRIYLFSVVIDYPSNTIRMGTNENLPFVTGKEYLFKDGFESHKIPSFNAFE